MIAEASRRFPAIEYREGDAENLDFADGSFDAVICSFGLLHMAEPERAIGEAHRVTSPRWRYGSRCGRHLTSDELFRHRAAGYSDACQWTCHFRPPHRFSVSATMRSARGCLHPLDLSISQSERSHWSGSSIRLRKLSTALQEHGRTALLLVHQTPAKSASASIAPSSMALLSSGGTVPVRSPFLR